MLVKHIGDFDAVGRNDIAGDGVVHQAFHATTVDSHFHLGAFRTFQQAHYILVFQRWAAHERVLDRNKAVTSQDAYLFGWATLDDVHDGDGVVFDAELHSDALEAAQ